MPPRPRCAAAIALLLLASWLLAPAPPATTAQTSAPPLEQALAAVDDYLQRQVAEQGIVGLAVAVVEGDQPVHARGFGVAGPAGDAVTPQTPFLLASVTKSFTALAVMQLVAAGQIDLQAPVQRYLPWFRVADEDASARITIADLLYHTSGFSTRTGNAPLVRGGADQTTLENYVRALRDVSLDRPPGTRVEYSNTNYRVLGLVVQTLSGEPYPLYLQRHILAPLAMDDSYAIDPSQPARPMALAIDTASGTPRPVPVRMPAYRVPSGGVVASAEDMAHYLVAQSNGGRYGAASVLPSPLVDQMHAIGAPTVPNAGAAMGWFVRTTDGVTTISHNGAVAGHRTFQALLPDVDRAFAVLLTLDVTLPPPNVNAIGRDLSALLRGRPATLAPAEPD